MELERNTEVDPHTSVEDEPERGFEAQATAALDNAAIDVEQRIRAGQTERVGLDAVEADRLRLLRMRRWMT